MHCDTFLSFTNFLLVNSDCDVHSRTVKKYIRRQNNHSYRNIQIINFPSIYIWRHRNICMNKKTYFLKGGLMPSGIIANLCMSVRAIYRSGL